MFYITVLICDDGYYATINENEQVLCKGEKINKKSRVHMPITVPIRANNIDYR